MHEKKGSIKPLVIVSCGRSSPRSLTFIRIKHSSVTTEKPYLFLEFQSMSVSHTLDSQESETSKKMLNKPI